MITIATFTVMALAVGPADDAPAFRAPGPGIQVLPGTAPALEAAAEASAYEASGSPAGPTAVANAGTVMPSAGFCAPDPEPPEYYAFPLVTTKNVPGTGLTSGTAETTFASTPFGVAVGTDGSYVHDVHLTFERLPEPPRGRYVAWATTTELDRIERLGVVEPGRTFTGRVSWNKFLVVVTLEEEDDPAAARWSGPIVLRGMSRSGMMHTMAGHGPFQQENCAAYGYD